MSEFFDPYNADRPLMMKCSCGRDHTVADHHAEVAADEAARVLRQRSESAEFEAYSNEFIEATLQEDAPQQCVAREDGWLAFRVAGQMDFSLTGVLAGLSAVLAQAGISIFAVSTFDTDYVLVKQDRLAAALAALESAGYGLEVVSG